ncbi:MAG: ABC transporter permease, partial [Vallitaleaceae bacterium]|nr:ABC transporter permease [Vallitaleaceae bacterium]
VIQIQANLSAHAARVGLSPVHKLKAFLAGITASLLIHYIEVLVLISYLHFALGIDFGTKTAFVLLTAFVGSIVGISFGAFISALVKGDEGVKTGICIGASMFGSFLAGMMFEGMKYIVDTKFPMIAKLNPVGVLTDSFYALYYYDGYERYSRNLINLVIFSLVFCGVTYTVIRRQKYASI